ncbi:FAD-binding oxidoreductase [Rhizobium sp. SEMIA 4085]|uniref:FAD dependent oxidoreductase protein n=1 Tax=Rhizobium gallicum bv. gallicum R602sp TaxID=1041138 RepID=A0A0B4X0E6_9HYPH|nr:MULTISPECIES: FAD-binding oxidoreductase [Rhizobium]AJD40023.1 FAD dependent oxidoreductase protein [Rhizobium gallicum bv. gallicum R602sp]NNH29373.1 FAD-binding oxidoreductase [Rhizobium sp. SEMIA 4085]
MEQSRIADKNSPYWWEAAPVKPLPRQPLAKKLDVAIIGAGYAGLSAGLVLARDGRSVAAFDAMNPGEGASSRNGGITSGSIRPDYATIARRFGEDKAIAIEAEGKIAREFLYDFIRTEGLDCDFNLVGQFKGVIGFDQYEKTARSAETLAKRLGIESYAVPYTEQRNYIGTDFYRGGMVRMDIGGLHPAKFHAELLRVALASGLTVHSGTRVTSVEKDGSGFRVVTSAGTIQARQVLVCTDGYTDGAVPFLRRRLVPVRSRIIVTEELASDVMARLMPKQMMMVEGKQLGFYYRPTPDGKRILLGGRDSSRVGDPDAPKLLLRRGLVDLFPELENVRLSHTWFGNVAMHRDMLPRIFEKDGVVYATGFCGSGVVWAPWVGMHAAHKLLGHGQEARTAFDFRPPAFIPFYNGNPWFMPAIIQGYRIQDQINLYRASR